MQNPNIITFQLPKQNSEIQKTLTENLNTLDNIQQWQKPHLAQSAELENIVKLAREYSEKTITTCEKALNQSTELSLEPNQTKDKIIVSAVKFLVENPAQNIFPLLEKITTQEILEKIKKTLFQTVAI